MILEFLFDVGIFVVKILLNILSIFPDMPDGLTNFAEQIAPYASTGGAFIKKVAGETLTIIIFTTLTAIVTIWPVWKTIMWAYRRVRG